MANTRDTGYLRNLVAYDGSGNITLPANLTVTGTIVGYVPTSRTITINGTSYDLTANRSWNITSMIYPGAGIAVSTGTAWGTSITDNSANWNTAYTNRITSLTVTGNSGAATLVSNVLNIPTYTLVGLGGEPTITAGTTAQYYRGDKSFQTLNTTAVAEGTNLYYTDARARAALSFVAGSGAYNSTTGVITIPTNTNQLTNGAGFITSYTETDTLATVTARSATTNTAVIINNNLAVNTSSPYNTSVYSLDINGGLLVKNTGRSASLTIINADPSVGGNNAFVVHTVGGTSSTSYVDIQGYYGTSITGSTTIKLNAAGGNVLIGSLIGTGTRMVVVDSTGVLSTQAIPSAGGVTSFNTRTGAITLSSSDVTTALGFTPYNSTNPSGYLTGITSTQVTNALGFTPYNATNPNGYITSSALSGYATQSWVSSQGYLTSVTAHNQAWSTITSTPTTLSGYGITDALYSVTSDFTTAGSGWYRVAVNSGDGRGYYYVEVYATGGNHNPAYMRIEAMGDWGSDKLIAVYTDNGYPASAVRITRGASTTYIEVNFTTTIASSVIRITRLGYNAGPSAYSGSLPAGGDTVKESLTVNSRINTSSLSISGNSVLHAGNYTSYSPSLTGTGASGTWGINITGSAGSATQVVTVQSSAPSGVDGKLWWETTTGKLKVYYASSSAWVDTMPMPDTNLYFLKAGGSITGSVVMQQDLTVTGQISADGILKMKSSGTSYIRMGNFPASTTNAGEAWIGRASDRSTGSMTVQLGGSSNSSFFEVVDYGWTTVTLRVGMNDFSYKGNAIYNAGTFSYSSGVNASHVVQRDANGYIYGNYFNSNTSETENPTINTFFVSNGDGWHRKATIAHVKSQLGLGSMAYASTDSYLALSGGTLTGTLGLPNNALISVNAEPDTWGARFRTTTSTTNLGASLKNIIWTGGGSLEGFAVTGSGTGGAAFEVRNDGVVWAKSTIYSAGNAVVTSGNIGSQSVSNASNANYSTYSYSLLGGNGGSFTLGGDTNTFYPVLFSIGSGSTSRQGIAVLQIERGGYDQPGYSSTGFGTFHCRIRAKADGWGYGASYVQLEQNAYTIPMLADFGQNNYSSELVVWLRGGQVYQWMSIEGNWGVSNANSGAGNVNNAYNTNTYYPTTTNSVGNLGKWFKGWSDTKFDGSINAYQTTTRTSGIFGTDYNSSAYINISENQIWRTGGGDLYINNSGTGHIRVGEGGGSLLVNTGTKWNNEKLGIQISNANNWTNVPAMMRLTNYGSGYIPKITFTDSSIIDGWLGMIPISGGSYFVMGFSGYTEQALKVYQNGNVVAAGDVTAYSDARVKTNVKTIENALDKTLALRGVSYNRTDNGDLNTKIGVIAQEVLDIIPEVVNKDTQGMYNVSYGNMAGLFIEAIKEQQAQIEELKKQIEYLVENK